ncbi:hypothetical protein H5410_052221 [Solanum commersonii]|uniref:Uncharacterized protein n=1 Tax=Solanum commersonii TaxID=4109 RepID=A0A9J5X0U4_SOLCO|nr:hypothetical protein H5410_052221 [Solanum commersonii]
MAPKKGVAVAAKKKAEKTSKEVFEKRPKQVWYRWGAASEEGCNKECEMASECYPPKEEEDSQDAIEGPSCSQSVHQNP